MSDGAGSQASRPNVGSQAEDDQTNQSPVPAGTPQFSPGNSQSDAARGSQHTAGGGADEEISRGGRDDPQEPDDSVIDELPLPKVVPVGLAQYWDDNVPDTLKTCPITADKIFRGACLTPTQDQCRRMYARSKCMKLLSSEDPLLLSDPTQSLPMCFIQKAGAELPIHIQKSIFFWTSLANHAASDITHFTAPCDTVGLVMDRSDPKLVRSLVSTGLGLGDQRQPDGSNSSQQDGFVNINDILADRDLEQSGGLHLPVSPVSMYVGYTGVVFTENGVEKREVFCGLTVIPAANFDVHSYVQQRFLLRPKQGCQKYEQLLELYLEASSFWKEMMRFEIYENLGVDERRFRVSEKYRAMPGGGLGDATVLSPFQIPLKIFNQIKRSHPKADLASIRILGMPRMTFRHTDETTCEWLQMMDASINADQERQMRLSEGIRRYDLSKEKDSIPDLKLACLGGWPCDIDESTMAVTSFVLPPFPLMHSVDTHGAGGKFDNFIASLGEADKALPDITRAILTAFLVNSTAVNVRPDLGHFLKDKRIANPLTCLREWFGYTLFALIVSTHKHVTDWQWFGRKDVDPFNTLILANRNGNWLSAMTENVKLLRDKGESLQGVIKIRADYLVSAVKNLESMIESGVFRSNTVTQMLQITRLMDYASVCTEHTRSISAVIADKSFRVPRPRKYDPFFRAWDTHSKLWEEMNKYFHLNSGNLCGAVEVMISELMFKFAHTNRSWTFFYATVIFEGGNGHFSVHTPDGPLPDRKKVNNMGMDFLLARICDLWATMYDILLIPKKDRLHEPLTTMRTTPTVWENLSCATSVAGRIVSIPPNNTNFQAMTLSESRDDQGPLIHYGLSRGPENNVASLGRSEDPNKNGVVSLKLKVVTPCILAISSNLSDINKSSAEKGKTIDAVGAVFANGCAPPAPKKRKTTFADSSNNAANPRNQELPSETKDRVANCLAFSHNFAGLYVGLINHIGAMPLECSTVSLASYAWVCHYIKQFAGGMMDTYMIEGFSRAIEGYKSRGVMFSVWLKVMCAMSAGKGVSDTLHHIWMDISTDAFPLLAIPAVGCNILYRSVHMGSFLILTVLAADLGFPCISWKSLDRFFNATAPPAADDPDTMYREEFEILQEFVQRCFNGNRFCPDDEGLFGLGENVSCYITSDGADETMVPLNKSCLMRLNPSKEKDESQDLTSRIGQRIDAKEGRRLFTQCQMGPGFYPYKYALVFLLERFSPDLRGLASTQMYYSRKHLDILGFQGMAPGLANYDDPDPMPFARQFNFKAGMNDIRSQAIGINIWSTLALVSLMGGTDLHSSVTKKFSNSFMELLLAFSPTGLAPGGMSTTFDYDPVNTKPLKLYYPVEDRPNHFWRPENASFVRTGVLALAPAMGRFLPEDCFTLPLHDIAKTLHCDVMDVPGNAFTTTPTLEPDVWYSYHIPDHTDGEYGALKVCVDMDCVEVSRYNKDGTSKDPQQLSLNDWDEYLKAEKMVVTPLIKRLGVCVVLDMPGDDPSSDPDATKKTLGCLITNMDPGVNGLFNPVNCTYRALIGANMETTEIFFYKLLRHALVPVGEVLYMDMSVIEDDRFRAQGGSNAGKFLYTRLSVPNVRIPEEGKLYVAALYQPVNNRGRRENYSSSITFAVNPWDVQLVSEYAGEPRNIVKNLK